MLNTIAVVLDFIFVFGLIGGIAYMQVKVEKLAYQKLKEDKANGIKR